MTLSTIKANLLKIVHDQIETSFKKNNTVKSDAMVTSLLKVFENISDPFEFSQTENTSALTNIITGVVLNDEMTKT